MCKSLKVSWKSVQVWASWFSRLLPAAVLYKNNCKSFNVVLGLCKSVHVSASPCKSMQVHASLCKPIQFYYNYQNCTASKDWKSFQSCFCLFFHQEGSVLWQMAWKLISTLTKNILVVCHLFKNAQKSLKESLRFSLESM
jgi:hypothetical protein